MSITVREAVNSFLIEFGYEPAEVTELVVDPWGVTIETYSKGDSGLRGGRVSRHFPMTEQL